MKNTFTEQDERRIAELIFAFSTIRLTPLQRKFFICSIMQTDIPKNKKDGFEIIENKKGYFISTLKIFGATDRIGKPKKEELEKLLELKPKIRPNADMEVEIQLFEKLEFTNMSVIYQLHTSLYPYFKHLKEIYNEYNLEYLIFSKCKNAPMLYLLLQKHGIINYLYANIYDIKRCLYISPNIYQKDSDFYKSFILPAVEDINLYSHYMIDCSYKEKGYVCFDTRLKTKEEMLSVPVIDSVIENEKDYIYLENPL